MRVAEEVCHQCPEYQPKGVDGHEQTAKHDDEGRNVAVITILVLAVRAADVTTLIASGMEKVLERTYYL